MYYVESNWNVLANEENMLRMRVYKIVSHIQNLNVLANEENMDEDQIILNC